MREHRRKPHRERDLTRRYLAGDYEADAQHSERFSARSKNAEQNKILKTAQMRAEEAAEAVDLDALPTGRVMQVFSLYCEVEAPGGPYLCVTRKTLQKVSNTAIIVGDVVRFRATGDRDDQNRAAAVIEEVLPRTTVLTRSESFKQMEQHPIVANAEQMLIVVALAQPAVRWGLVDRMIVAAQTGGLRPIVCLNKVDLDAPDELREAGEVLEHYGSLQVQTLRASATSGVGLEELRAMLTNRFTVLAGHSGVGKSSLIRSIQPHLDIRIGAVSGYTLKGRHTTTSARLYHLDFGGSVVDTPGVKLFGLWGLTADNLEVYFPDIANGSAPAWRQESYQRILESLPPQ